MVVSERGEAAAVGRHPGFRVFLLADPARGEISRAMRNRCVELWCGDSGLGGGDRQLLAGALLGPAALSRAVKAQAAPLLDGGLVSLSNRLALVRHDILTGGASETEEGEEPAGPAVLLGSLLSTRLASSDSALFSCLDQARPLTHLSHCRPDLTWLAVEQFLHYAGPGEAELRAGLAAWLLGEHWADTVSGLAARLQENRPGPHGLPWDWRLAARAAQQGSVLDTNSRALRLALLSRQLQQQPLPDNSLQV